MRYAAYSRHNAFFSVSYRMTSLSCSRIAGFWFRPLRLTSDLLALFASLVDWLCKANLALSRQVSLRRNPAMIT
jgi:hypothetical protein